MPERLRVGFVGAGYISEYHALALRRAPTAELLAVTDVERGRADALAARFGIARVCGSVAEFEALGVDVVHVLTPPDTHEAVVMDALERGMHVLVEKPLATSVEACERIADAARRSGRVVGVVHSLLRDPTVVRALRLVRIGRVGEVVRVDIARAAAYPPYRGGPLPVHYRQGGYAFRDLGVHAIYLLQAFLGSIVDVDADFRKLWREGGDPNLPLDEWDVRVHASGGIGHLWLSCNSRPEQHVVTVFGTRGTLRADLFGMMVTVRPVTRLPRTVERVANSFGEAASQARQVTAAVSNVLLGRVGPLQGLQDSVRAFHADLAEGRRPSVGVDEGREAVRWTETIARRGDAVAPRSLRGFSPNSGSTIVTGAAGVVGGALVRRLLECGTRVRALVHRPVASDFWGPGDVDVVEADLGNPEAVEAALDGATTVFHVGAAMRGPWAAHECGTIAGTRNVVAACERLRVRRLVHVSSLTVLALRQAWGAGVVDETYALEQRPEERGDYTRAKLAAEQLVREAAAAGRVSAVVVRPGQVWTDATNLLSPGVGIRIRRWLVLIGKASAPLPLVHVSDLVEGLRLAADRARGEGEIFNLVDEATATRGEVARFYVMHVEPTLRIVHLPLALALGMAWFGEQVNRALRRSLLPSRYRLLASAVPLRFDCRRARTDLGWRPRTHWRDWAEPRAVGGHAVPSSVHEGRDLTGSRS